MSANDFADQIKQYEQTTPSVEVRVGDCTLRYLTPNTRCLWRVQTLATKEPITIQWLNALPEGACLLDIGANVGMYSVYAAVVRKARVFAFEPEAQNYALLCKNLILNGLGDRCVAWNAALSDETKFDRIYVSDADVGGSCHSFGEQVDAHLRPVTFPLAQGCFATTVDRLVAEKAMTVPSHIKIDVDGFEHKIIKGAAETLKNATVRSLIVEINANLAAHRAVVDVLASLGFRHDPRQFQDAQRKEGFFKGVGEDAFER